MNETALRQRNLLPDHRDAPLCLSEEKQRIAPFDRQTLQRFNPCRMILPEIRRVFLRYKGKMDS